MQIREIYSALGAVKTNCAETVEMGNPIFDSRKVKNGDVFFALNGSTDGNIYVSDAIERGAAVVVSEIFYPQLPCIQVESVRESFASYCAAFYGHPERRLKIIGVTGTNGKTSVTRILSHVLEKNNYKTATIGTLGAMINGKEIDTGLTTPDADLFYKLLAEAAEKKTDFVIMEISAHGIYYQKTFGVKFEYGIFTNLSRDHLDFFGTMENYGAVKKSWFLDGTVKKAVINTDDALGLEIFKCRKTAVLSYGLYSPSDVFAVNEKYENGTRFVINAFDEISWGYTPLMGEFNLYNTLAAITVAYDLGISLPDVCNALSSLGEIEGRFNTLFGDIVTVIIDYAHTPDGLEKVLSAARGITENNLICVFGCGGNRDREKRPIMGEIAQKLADICIVTSDNPRYEEPEKIIEEIIVGADRVGRGHIAIADRERAILFALRIAEKGDTVLIAGKGAEKYMDIKGVKHPFSDREICEKALGRK